LTAAIYYSREDRVLYDIFRGKKGKISRLLLRLHHDEPRIEDLRIVLNMATTLNDTKPQLSSQRVNTGEINEHETVQRLVLPEETSVIVT